MKSRPQNHLQNLIGKINQFVFHQKSVQTIAKSPKEYHYCEEIMRFKSKIHFVHQKISRQLPRTMLPKSIFLPLQYYLIYRYLWEKEEISLLWREVNQLLTSINAKKNMKQFLFHLQRYQWDIALKNKDIQERLSIGEAYPNFIINQLKPHISWDILRKNLHSMNESSEDARFSFRLNVFEQKIEIVSREAQEKYVMEECMKVGLDIRKDPALPGVFSLPIQQKNLFMQLEVYKRRLVLVQQKPSLIAVNSLDISPSDRILDFCAAPGMKASYGMILQPKLTQYIANDYSRPRLQKISSIIPTFKLPTINFIQSDATHPPLRPVTLNQNSNPSLYTKILIDAPCTGSGTFATNPELKWRQNPLFLKRFSSLQEKMLQEATKLLSSGGVLVYATCSLFYEEGEAQIEKIKSFFKPGDLGFPNSSIYSFSDSHYKKAMHRFFPYPDDTIGFFITKLIKR